MWPGPQVTGGVPVFVAALAAGAAMAIFFYLGLPGIGQFLGALSLTAAVIVAVARVGTPLSRAERFERLGWAGASLALVAVLTFRNAWWLVAFCALGALGCAALAVFGPRRVQSMAVALLWSPVAIVRGVPWLRATTRGVVQHGGSKANVARQAVWSVLGTLVLLLTFGSLLSSADAAFGRLLQTVVPSIGLGSVIGSLLWFVVGVALVAGAAFVLIAPPNLRSLEQPAKPRFGRMVWAMPIGALVLLFAVFVGVQLTVLFGGRTHLLKTAHLSAAEYARGGFWQLAVVTVLTLLVVSGTVRWARQEPGPDRRLLRLLLGPLCALTVVIVASALSRMATYQQAYSYTGERIFVMSLELLLGVVFLLVLVAGIRWRGSWLPRATVGLLVALLLALAALNPEGYAAGRNVQRFQQTGKIDLWYLRALSADATPALVKLAPKQRGCALAWVRRDLAADERWYEWNWGRHRARQALHAASVSDPNTCSDAGRYDYSR